MEDAYEQFATLFMETLAGKLSGASRQQVIEKAKQKFQNVQAFEAFLNSVQAQADQKIAQVQAQLKPGDEIAIAYVVDTAPEEYRARH